MTQQDLTSAEPIILAIDTSSKATSLAVARGGVALTSISERPDQKRSETLWTEIRSLLASVGKAISDIDVFSVCIGPGGFTGLRVGMAAVKGFASATNKPIIGVTSLEAAAFSAKPAVTVCAMVNAYKGEVYSQLFSFDRDGIPVARNSPMASTLETAIERVAHINDLVFAGDGAEAERQAILRAAAARGEGNWRMKQSERAFAEEIAQLVSLKHARGILETPASLKACYVRPAEAEIKLSMGLLGSKIKRSMEPERR